MKKYFIVLFVGIVAMGCTNADISRIGALGSVGEITCYSGGNIIYHGKSTGKIETENGSDGWYFQEDSTKNLIRVSGDCVIRN